MPTIQRSIGRYDVVDVIGRGATAVVYLAHQRHLDRFVALKELTPSYAADRSLADCFVEGSRLTAAMSHPSIVTVHEYFEEGGTPVIAMEYMARGSLRPLVGGRDLAGVAKMLEDVLGALAHSERHGVVHREIKPENLLIADDGRVKIADFGVAGALHHAAEGGLMNRPEPPSLTQPYAAPEQLRAGELTAAADLYSLGVVTWELLTGRSPDMRQVVSEAVSGRNAHAALGPTQTLIPGCNAPLQQWLEQMLHTRPEQRFQSARSAWESLEDIVIDLLGSRWRHQARLVPGVRGRRSEAVRYDARPSPKGNGRLGPRRRGLAHAPAPVAHTDRSARRRARIALVSGSIAAATLTLALVIRPAGEAPKPRPGAHLSAPGTRHPHASTTLASNVAQLNAIVKLFVAGKRLSHQSHHFQKAAQNRQLVLARLVALDAQPELRSAIDTLHEMTLDSLSFNLDMSAGQSLLARIPDTAHNVLRPRFVAEFNPYAQRFLGIAYRAGEL